MDTVGTPNSKPTVMENISKEDILNDYYTAWLSRNMSLIGRKEVLTGKAKFGIFGDGKELPQIAMAKTFKNGDWRSGYYRDQTFMLATGMTTAEEFFHQLYGNTDVKENPSNAGRSFNNHYGTRSLNEDGSWKNIAKQKNSASDLSPTAGQMPRLLGLAYASKLYRHLPHNEMYDLFTTGGNEVAFGMIGDASTSEGHFFEVLNAASVMQVPLAMAVWDDGYGISVQKELQTVKASISEALKGFEKHSGDATGIVILKARGWNYKELVDTFKRGVDQCRNEQVPVLFHITELTQPQGHSTSGSHERYKTKERLEWEQEYDCLKQLRKWILEEGLANEQELNGVEQKAADDAKQAKQSAWKKFLAPIETDRKQLLSIVESKSCMCKRNKFDKVKTIAEDLKRIDAPIRKDVLSAAKRLVRHVCTDCENLGNMKDEVREWIDKAKKDAFQRYSTHITSESEWAAVKVEEVKPAFSETSKSVNGREIIRDNYEVLLSKYPNVVIFGEDVGKIGGVNQTYEGLQDRFGELRVSDTGIRETSIIGQGIGLALRGFRPVAEIQYFDYILYGLQTMSDDLATLLWRTKGGQKAPLIITTRGHRLEGIWHSGSPLSMVINSIRGIHVCVPRNMTQAAGMYNTLLKSDDPALVVEPLNGYRLKELRPDNIGEYCVPIGVAEVLIPGEDVTLVTYGSCVRIAQDATKQLAEFGISVELVDAQSLLPFDRTNVIVESLKKTGRAVFFDEDVPGGATAYMMQKIVEERGGFYLLEDEPRTITAKEHRPAFASDGDYFSNPNAEDVFEVIYDLMHSSNPTRYPKLL